ncbi:MAG: DNA-protecting protein DprA [Rhodobacterales bacterium]|nr:MAG: DNA-protecting protein DprA [Rhodobacterales bacterium]
MRSGRVGPRNFRKLIAKHGGAAGALAALPALASAKGLRSYKICPREVAAAELAAARRISARFVPLGSRLYPPALAQIPDAPPFLWARGNLALLARPKLAMVGSRNASSLGLRMARKLAADLAKAGQVVVSGLARGVDTQAHEAALEGGTIAVVAGGVDVVYPAENARLTAEIAERGLILSEAPMGCRPQARHFPARNRIISGLCPATIVVEAAARSGSLITARNAGEQGREVMAVPGHPFDSRASGCNLLLRDGATLIRNARDVLDALPDHANIAEIPAETADVTPAARPAAQPTARPATQLTAQPAADRIIERAQTTDPYRQDRRSLAETASLHSQILASLTSAPMPEDALLRDLGQPVQDVLAELTNMELEGRIERQEDGRLIKLP